MRATVLAVVIVLLTACAELDVGPRYNTADVHTPKPTLAFLGDVQPTGQAETWRENNDSLRPSLIRGLAMDDPDAVVLLGDMVWAGSSILQWRTFDTVMRPLRKRNIPMYPLLGNHEYIGVDALMMQRVQQRFPGMHDGPYVRVEDSIAIVFLNTNLQEIGLDAAKQELAWFRAVIPCLDDSAAIKAIIVCGHHPPFTNSTVVEDDPVLKKYFVPTFLRAEKTLLWFSGHCHSYEHFSAYGKHWITSGGGGGPRQPLLIGARRRHRDLYTGPSIRPLHYCLVERTGMELTVTVRALDAIAKRMETMDYFTVSNSRAVPVAPTVEP